MTPSRLSRAVQAQRHHLAAFDAGGAQVKGQTIGALV